MKPTGKDTDTKLVALCYNKRRNNHRQCGLSIEGTTCISQLMFTTVCLTTNISRESLLKNKPNNNG